MLLDFISHILNDLASIERLQSSIIAIFLVCLFGAIFGSPLTNNANPFLWTVLDRLIGSVGRKTYNTNRSLNSLVFRGGLLFIVYLVVICLIVVGIVWVKDILPLEGFMEPFLLTLVLVGGASWSSLLKLHRAIEAEEKKQSSKTIPSNLPQGSFYDIAVSTRTNLNTTDTHGIIRGGIGYSASSFDKGMIAPLFWYLVGGLPAAFIYSGIAAARWGLAKEGFSKGIGIVPLKIEKCLGSIPQLLTALFLTIAAAATPSSRVTRSVMGIVSREGYAPYAEGGLPVTVTAWGLGISLGGPVEDSDGSVLKRAWVGSKTSTAKAEKHHLRIAIYQNIMAHIFVLLALFIGLVAWRFSSI